ncbi:cupin domain-containing protein [Marinomonas mediterranea]|jgi:Cupin domain.|uniref:Cupin 2 conserved barrel domain protein n=1 Tax=Marinomonas mediterranea (strain ATCC 700492 / JCM 21426 / NBRC 103028 / MMB-1) TaxID=717774 RepID=F2JTM6_MARM1|nr:cupin domain-containing protein [Marinomonas mediterranea]ADZ92646.1 Cupin 2 conserved barrel domain protein [Marinomonas mediterranea MMB-1]WCN14635.1 cupin domain-containing protein [Marinomonas mediterranea]WCN18682.1 cupin domain-containing protein [Marinomonas mediterranea MMB-1]
MNNVFSDIPKSIPDEIFEDILSTGNIRIERIVSDGHSSPDVGWYDQSEHEWVLVLKGQGVIEFEAGRICTLSEGDFINIEAGTKHKVLSTSPDEVTIWLAIFYS